MMARTGRRTFLLLIISLMLLLGLLGILEIWKWRQYSIGREALGQGNWSVAFYRLHALTEWFPNYRDSPVLLADVSEGMARIPSDPLTHEAAMDLRAWLDESHRTSLLAQMLDESVANVPAGYFIMGSEEGDPHEQPVLKVYLDAYAIDRYEVTNVQYHRFVQASQRIPPRYWNGQVYPEGTALLPVVGVSWEDASGYCDWVGKRLPTEAEWERACRGELGQTYPWGDNWDPTRANLNLDRSQGWPRTIDEAWSYLAGICGNPFQPCLMPIGSYPHGVSSYGVFDMAGNASEWVFDWYNWGGYDGMPLMNPVNTEPPWNHSIRGSGWFDRYGNQNRTAFQSRCSARNSSHSYDDPRVGFRCALSPP